MGEKNIAAAKDRSLRAVRTPAGIANAKEARTADDGCGKPRQDAGNSSTNREKLPRTLTGKRERAWEPLGRTEALTGVALGCFLAWVPMTFQSLNIVGDKGEPVLDTVYLISICTLLLTQIIIGIEHRRCALWLAKRPARTGSAMATGGIHVAAARCSRLGRRRISGEDVRRKHRAHHRIGYRLRRLVRPLPSTIRHPYEQVLRKGNRSHSRLGILVHVGAFLSVLVLRTV